MTLRNDLEVPAPDIESTCSCVRVPPTLYMHRPCNQSADQIQGVFLCCLYQSPRAALHPYIDRQLPFPVGADTRRTGRTARVRSLHLARALEHHASPDC
jgi:hypothetical protein